MNANIVINGQSYRKSQVDRVIDTIRQGGRGPQALTVFDIADKANVHPLYVKRVITQVPDAIQLRDSGYVAVYEKGTKPKWYNPSVHPVSTKTALVGLPPIPADIVNVHRRSDLTTDLLSHTVILRKTPLSPKRQREELTKYAARRIYAAQQEEKFENTAMTLSQEIEQLKELNGLLREKVQLHERLTAV